MRKIISVGIAYIFFYVLLTFALFEVFSLSSGQKTDAKELVIEWSASLFIAYTIICLALKGWLRKRKKKVFTESWYVCLC
ncbi:hypothetical protein [Brochothrix campestris]|uniref:Uncharacterized protein n=1 Tax=Brochothrix campestris FSL F6-1037 TaxID=1265861 RepID=W7D1V9_9LIST|nr:hypothetical protein [Brochothrix campestris]EUJ41916.1 hypothetical protein BCAMP_01670 [Brochothrix campestris FSL F6-1037]